MEIMIVVLAAVTLAFIIVWAMKSGHNTASGENRADAYIKNFNLTRRDNIFLFSTVTRREKPKNDKDD